MLERFAAAILLFLTLEQAFAASSAQIVGSWKSDNGRTYAEVHFRRDHSFTLFARMSMRNPELAITQMAEQFGTWQIAGDRLHLDATHRGSKERSRINIRFRLRADSLKMQNVYVASSTDTYTRLHLPVCAELRSAAHPALDESILVGRWRGHYRTHDAEFAFQPDRHVDFYLWDLGSRRKFSEATWRLRKDVVSMKAHRDDGHITWHILRVGRRCIVVSDGSEMSYTLQRIE